jgi:hypothetical protein
MSNRSKSRNRIMTLLLLKTTSNKTSLITLKKSIRVSLNLIDQLTNDRMNMWGTWHKILQATSKLLSRCVLPFWMKNSITIRSWLRKSSGYESRRRVIARWPAKVVTTSNKLLWRGIYRRGGLKRRRRWHILNKRRRWHIRKELIRRSRAI